MKRSRIVAVFGLVVVGGMAAHCQGEEVKDQSVRDYLGESGGPLAMYAWEKKVGEAICQLEEHNQTGLDPNKRICPGGPGSITPPPKYPPQ